jgi:cobalt/nickel transport protein
MRLPLLLAAVALGSASTVQAHYHILLPDRHSVKVGDKVTLTYVFGHPFEHDLFDTEKPTKATLFSPDGKATDVLAALQKVETNGHGNKQIAAYQYVFQPEGRGDFTIVFESPPIWMADEKQFFRDTARVTIHVETQKGWDARLGDATQFAVVPLTRPYGLRAGMVFQASVYPGESSGVSHQVEVERFNPQPPAALPPDEHITLSVKTDRNGTATSTLPDAGWWAMTAIRRYPAEAKPPTREREGAAYPLVERATLWVLVEDRVPLKPVE